MNQTQLIIYDNASGIVQYEVDLYDNEPIQLTKQIFDVENPDERVADFSRTIKLPGTHTNNQIFGHFFDLNRFTINDTLINFNDDFNATLKANALLYFNNVLQSRGSLQLTNVINLPDGGCEYEVVFIGEVKNLFQDVSDLVLSDLDLSQYNHILDYDTIEASWQHTYASGFVYPLIDYGFSFNQRDYTIEQIYPAVFLKTVVDKIFSEAGYSYSSNFLNSDFFKSMIIPFNGGSFSLNEDAVNDRTGQYDVSANTTISTYGVTYPISLTSFPSITYARVPFNRIQQDTNPTGYSTSTFEYTVPSGFQGKFYVDTLIDIQFTSPSSAGSASYDFNFFILHEDSTGLLKNLQLVSGSSATISSSTTIDLTISNDNQVFFNVVPSDKIYVLLSQPIANTGSGASPVNHPVTIKENSSITLRPFTQMNYEGSTIVLSSTLSNEVKQRELLLSIVRMFNLYIESDVSDNRKLIIEPRNDYYVSGTVDWTNKVDYNSEIRIKPVSLSKYNEYTFQYAEDKDVFNSVYQQTSTYTYGHRRFDIINQFVEEEKEIKVEVAPTPLSRWTTNNLPMSVIYFADNNNQRQVKNSKLRILFYKRYPFTDVPPLWSLTSNEYGKSDLYVYPYAGHLDDIYDPQFDLNWGVPTVLYYNPKIYTNANLFNTYWIDYIRSITDPDSKAVEMMLHLNEVDINNLSFRKRYLIDRQYYILHNIEYDLVDNGLAKCTFLKLVGKYNYQTVQSTVNGGTGQWPEGDLQQGGDGELKPAFGQRASAGNNNYDVQRAYHTANGYIIGQNNNIQSSGFNAGDNNTFVGNKTSAINSNGNKSAVSSVTFVNTNNYNATIDNEAVIQDVQFPFCKRVILTEAQIDALHTTRIELVPDASGFIVEYVDAYAVNRFGTTAYASHKIFIANTSGGENVAEFAATFSSASETCLQKANKIDQPLFTEGGLELYAGNNLNGGNGEFEFVVQYRLIKI